jgi:nitrogen fixation/metabolism regulation signal transduction histidine kinase
VEATGRKVSITVSDNGIGMEAELVNRAFELFSQGQRNADRSQGGLGIGLALVKNLAELHGGTTMLAMVVDAAGHHAVIEHSAMAALQQASIVQPDVCLLDVGLAGGVTRQKTRPANRGC